MSIKWSDQKDYITLHPYHLHITSETSWVGEHWQEGKLRQLLTFHYLAVFLLFPESCGKGPNVLNEEINMCFLTLVISVLHANAWMLWDFLLVYECFEHVMLYSTKSHYSSMCFPSTRVMILGNEIQYPSWFEFLLVIKYLKKTSCQ